MPPGELDLDWSIVDPAGGLDPFGSESMNPGGEGDGGDRSTGDVEPPEFAALRDDDRPVGGPAIAGKGLVDRPQAFGEIDLHRIHRDPLAAGFEIADPEGGPRSELFPLIADRAGGHLA